MSRKPRLTQARSNNRQSDTPDGMNARTRRQARRLGRQQKQLENEVGVGIPVVAGQSQSTRGRIVKYSDIKQIEPLTDTQADFFDAWEDDQAVGYVLFGHAGTGKSAISLYHAIRDVLNPDLPEYQKLIIIRSAVQSRDSGFLPGTLVEKMEAYEAPYHSLFEFLTGGNPAAYEKLKDMKKVEFMSSGYTRGNTFDNAIIVVDEIQNFSWQELHSTTTRVGKNSKIIFCGDGKQDDLHFKKNDTSGFKDFIDVSQQVPSFRHFKFTVDDIVRSGFVREWIIACERVGI